MAQKRGESAMGGKKSKAHKAKSTTKKPHEMHIRRSANGGYISKHIHKQPAGAAEMPEPEEHTIPDISSLQQHVGDHMAPEEGAGGAPAGGAPAGGMPAMPGM